MYDEVTYDAALYDLVPGGVIYANVGVVLPTVFDSFHSVGSRTHRAGQEASSIRDTLSSIGGRTHRLGKR
jgi:hypothetical protein